MDMFQFWACVQLLKEIKQNCEQAAVALAIPGSSRCWELCVIFACLLSAVRKKKKLEKKKGSRTLVPLSNGASNFLEIVGAAYMWVMFTFLYFSALFMKLSIWLLHECGHDASIQRICLWIVFPGSLLYFFRGTWKRDWWDFAIR